MIPMATPIWTTGFPANNRLIDFDRYVFADLDRIRLEHDMEGPLSLFDDVVHLGVACSAVGLIRHGYDHIGSVQIGYNS